MSVPYYCGPCGEFLTREQSECPFCTLPATPVDELPCRRCEARDRDYWKPGPGDPFWMLEAEDGEWLKNEYSLLGTRDAARAKRFPTEIDAYNHPARMTAGCKWWSAKPTEHLWIAASADTRPEGGEGTKIAAPFTSGAVPSETSADAQRTPDE